MSGPGPGDTKRSMSAIDALVEVSSNCLGIPRLERKHLLADYSPSLGTLLNSSSVRKDSVVANDYYVQVAEYDKDIANMGKHESGKTN